MFIEAEPLISRIRKMVDAHTGITWIEENGHITSAEEFRGDQNIRFGLGASDKIEAFDKKGDKKGDEKDNSEAKSNNKQKKKKKK